MSELHYAFPGKFRPMENQIRRFNFLLSCRKAFDLSEMRTGKTAAAAWAAHYLMQEVGGSTLIVCPLTCLHSVWQAHLDRMLEAVPGAPAVIPLRKGAHDRAKLIRTNPNTFFLLNYEGLLMAPVREAIAGSDIHTIIADEATALKCFRGERNKASSQRGTYFRELAAGRNVWALTATPMPNDPGNAFGLARAVLDTYTESWSRFRSRNYRKCGPFPGDWEPLPHATDSARALLQPSIRVLQSECFEVAPFATQLLDVALSPAQTKALKEMRNQLVMILAGKAPAGHPAAKLPPDAGLIVALNAGAQRTKLLQIAGGAVYTNEAAAAGERQVFQIDAPGRRAALLELLEVLDKDDKCVVFVPYRSQLQFVKDFLSEKYEVAVINGDVSPSERETVRRAFQGFGGPRIIVAEPRCMAHGIELDRANVAVWWLPIDDNELYTQANGRIQGRNQKKKCVAFQLCGTKLERAIYEKLDARQKLEADLLEILKALGDEQW